MDGGRAAGVALWCLNLLVIAGNGDWRRVGGLTKQLDGAVVEKLVAAPTRRVLSNWNTYLLGDWLQIALGLLLRLLLPAVGPLALDGLIRELGWLPHHLVVVVCLVPKR